MKRFQFVTTLVLEFKIIENVNEKICRTFYLNSRAETIFNESDIDEIFESISIRIISNIQKFIGRGLGWVIDSVIDHFINI